MKPVWGWHLGSGLGLEEVFVFRVRIRVRVSAYLRVYDVRVRVWDVRVRDRCFVSVGFLPGVRGGVRVAIWHGS